MDTCVFSQRSPHPCGPKRSLNHPLQTLDEIDASNLQSPGSRSTKVSWMILSRAGINYLSSSDYYGKWVICYNHRREFLDSWHLSKWCCYPEHSASDDANNCVENAEEEEAKNMVTLAMAIKVLQRERKVMPISGRICDRCKSDYDRSYPQKAGGMVVVIPRSIQPLPADNLMMPSPFCVPEEPAATARGAGLSQQQQPQQLQQPQPAAAVLLVQDASEPVLTMKTEVLDPGDEEITFKQETFDDPKEMDTEEEEEEKDDDESEDDDESLFSDESDDDRTWMPEKPAPAAAVGSKRPKLSMLDKGVKASAIVIDGGGGGPDKHYFCKVCKITFYKQASFTQHMRSSKEIHKEVLQRARQQELEEEEYECSDCCIAFRDKASQASHMSSVHKEKCAFYCEMCKVFMKSESAFKSHNSKLHLERREKSYYCRECDETFKCKAEHQRHISTHMLWSEQEPCLQCSICGKVFTSKQQVPYQRHLATHDVEPNGDCSCAKCSVDEPGGTRAAHAPSAEELRVTKNFGETNAKSLFERMQRNFAAAVADHDEEEEEEEEDGDDESAAADDMLVDCPSNPFECALCTCKFKLPTELEEHVLARHHQGGDAKVDKAESSSRVRPAAAAAAKRVFSVSVPPSTTTTTTTDSLKVSSECCVDRNWAAEFGYGVRKGVVLKSGDLISQMKMKFKLPNEEGDENAADDCSNLFRTRGFKGTVKASPKKSPRTLSYSSLTTRKRMESLIKRARDHQEMLRKNRSADKAKSKCGEQSDDIGGEGEGGDEEEDEDEFEGFEDEEDESLLIPMANGWVCEKKPKNGGKKAEGYKTAFWSPDGEQFQSLQEIASHCKRTKVTLEMAVFERALKKNPNKVADSQQQAAPSSSGAAAAAEPEAPVRDSRSVLSSIAGNIISDEEEIRSSLSTPVE